MHAVSTRVVIADCQPATISGVAYELQRNPGIRVVGTARSPGGLVSALEHRECDVVVTDCMMWSGREGPVDGIAMLASLQRDHPDIGLVVFTMIENPAVLASLQAQGISCIFSKLDDLDAMPMAIRAAEAMDEFLSPAIASIVRGINGEGSSSAGSPILTPRELEVLRLFVSGMTVNEIAARLGRRKQTISAQKWSGMGKLGITRDADLIRYAIDVKFI